MLALFLALATSALAAEPALEVARGEAALAEGDARAAYAHAREAVRADLDDWRAVRLWLRSGDALGLAGMVEAEVWGLSQRSGSLRVAHAWTRVAEDELTADTLALPMVRQADPQLAALAMGDQAMARGHTDLALTLLDDHPDAEAARVRIDALLAEGRHDEAAAAAEEAWLRHPQHPEVLRPYLASAERSTRKNRKNLLKQVVRRASQVEDPVFLWRARSALVGVDAAATAAIGAHLAALGEPARLLRQALPAEELEQLGTRWAEAPALVAEEPGDLTPAEVLVAGEHLVEVLDRRGERRAVGAALTRVRAQVDSATLAVRHAEALAESGQPDAALDAAAAALRLATGPAPDDVGRVQRGRQAAEIAAALGIRGRIRLERGDALGAAFDLVTAGVLSGAHQDPLAERALAAVGELPALKRQDEGGPHPLDAALSVAADRAPADPVAAAELARKVAMVPASGEPVARARLARAWTIAGNQHEPDRLVRAVVSAVLDPQLPYLERVADLLASAGEDDAAFVAWAVVRSQGAPAPGLLEAWRGVGSADDAADVIAALWTDAVSSAEPGAFADLGDPLPERVVLTTGGPMDLRELGDSVVVLNLWASWCGPCRVELPRLDQLTAGLQAEGLDVQLLAVSTDDTRDAWLGGARKLGLANAIMGWDPELGGAVGAVTVPLTLVIDRTGVIRARYVGWSEEHMPALEEEIRKLASP